MREIRILVAEDNEDHMLLTKIALRGIAGVQVTVPLDWLQAESAVQLRLRFSLWRQGLPVDALPLEGWIELQLVSEEELAAMA